MKWLKQAAFFISLLVFSWFSFGMPRETLTWWDANYQYRKQITVTNNDSIQLGTNTIVAFTADTSSLIMGGKLCSDDKDYRIVYDNGTSENEIAQLIEAAWNTSSTETWFCLQAAMFLQTFVTTTRRV